MINLGFKKPNWLFEEISKTKANIYVTPLERGNARTLGNSLRRALLSSIPGTAIIGFRFKGVNHEFQRMPGTVNDGTEMVIRFKEMKFAFENESMVEITFESSKAGTYYAKDLKLPDGVECLTPDVELFKLTGESKVFLSVFVKKARGYVASNELYEFDSEEFSDVIRIDGDFSPVTNVAIFEKNIRVGQDTTYQELRLEVQTDGTISPKNAITLASEIIRMQLSFVDEMKEYLEQFHMLEEEVQKENEIFDNPISTLDLSVRPLNCLTNAGYTTIGKLLSLTTNQLKAIDQLGKKSIEEIIEKLEKIGYKLKEE